MFEGSRPFLSAIGESRRECPAIRAEWSIKFSDVIETLPDLVLRTRVPAHIHSDNGPGFSVTVAAENASSR